MTAFSRLAALAALAALATSTATVASAQCGDQSPAVPPPQALWPDDVRPAPTGRPMNQLPDNRDSTSYITQTIPGLRSGHELFQSIVAVDDWLFVVYNAGLQVWELRNGARNTPARVAVADGWSDHWLEFPRPGEADSFLYDVAATRMPGGGYAIATAAHGSVGFALWHFDPETRRLTPRYQEPREIINDVALATLGGRVYAFAARSGGVHVFDASAALAGEPCVEDIREPMCPGVFLGVLADGGLAGYVAAHTFTRGGEQRLVVAVGTGSFNAGEAFVYTLDDPSRPGLAVDGGTARLRFEGIAAFPQGVALFEMQERAWLGVIDHFGGPQRLGTQVILHTIDDCLDGPCVLDAPAWASEHFESRAARKMLRHSFDDLGTPRDPSDDSHYLHVGFIVGPNAGPDADRLYHLVDVRPDGPDDTVLRVGADGPTYRDGCSDADVGYWGWSYGRNEDGMRAASPRSGVMVRDRFYRVARSIFDVHIRVRPEVEPEPEPDMGPPEPPADDMGPPEPADDLGPPDPPADDMGRPAGDAGPIDAPDLAVDDEPGAADAGFEGDDLGPMADGDGAPDGGADDGPSADPDGESGCAIGAPGSGGPSGWCWLAAGALLLGCRRRR